MNKNKQDNKNIKNKDKNYKKDFNKRNKRPTRRREKYPTHNPENQEEVVNVYFNSVGLKDLPHSSFGMQADPYDASMPKAQQYPLYNTFNKSIDVSYIGDKNIDGGNVQQYGSSTSSGWLKQFDSGLLKLELNYRYLPINPADTSRGQSLIDEMRKAISENVSTLQATTFTNLPINNFVVETDLPMGSAVTSSYNLSSGGSKNVYDDIVDVIYSSSIFYQIVLQSAVHTMDWHNMFRLKQGAMLQSCWDREVPTLNALFGLFNKTSFLNLLQSICYSFESEYLDNDFRKQINTLILTPSRKSDSMNDPILEIEANFAHPTIFNIYLKDNTGNLVSEPVFSLQRDMGNFFNNIHTINEKLSIEDTLYWARNTDLVTGVGVGQKGSAANERFNQVKQCFDNLIDDMTKFKIGMVDIRETFDVMSRTGVLYWEKGTQFYIEKETEVQLLWNVLVENVYRMCFAGDDIISFNPTTQRWQTYALWDIYKGIPSYDAISGGSFLTFSSKKLAYDGSVDPNVLPEQVEFLPILFNADDFGFEAGNQESRPTAKFVNRSGDVYNLGVKTVTIQENHNLARLAPLASQSTTTIRMPIAISNDEDDFMNHSLILKVLNQVFGYGEVVSSASDDEVYASSIDSNLLAIYSIEVSDITNISIAYARSNAPLRGDSKRVPVLGFSTTQVKVDKKMKGTE